MSDRARGWVLVVAQLILLAAVVLAPTGGDWSVPDAVRAVGTGGRVLGVLVIVIGALQLGRAASVHPAPTEGAVLRTTGAYRYVRHPIYSGVLLLAAAIAATAGTVVHLVLWAALAGVLTTKARFEERLLAEAFPDYPAYARRTGRFIPPLRPRAGRP